MREIHSVGWIFTLAYLVLVTMSYYACVKLDLHSGGFARVIMSLLYPFIFVFVVILIMIDILSVRP